MAVVAAWLIVLVSVPASVVAGEGFAAKLLGLGLGAAWWGVLAFLLAFAAGPTMRFARGGAVTTAWPGVALTALHLGVRLALVPAVVLLPALLASFVNPLMQEIFAAAGIIGGAGVLVALLGRWMEAPALAAGGMPPADALLRSRAET
ncbi:MAG: hypothetical protein LC624_10410, partial [Halobacteriales archaeon]|nr:hypothetical protein [Halobacteriales archaeon]